MAPALDLYACPARILQVGGRPPAREKVGERRRRGYSLPANPLTSGTGNTGYAGNGLRKDRGRSRHRQSGAGEDRSPVRRHGGLVAARDDGSLRLTASAIDRLDTYLTRIF